MTSRVDLNRKIRGLVALATGIPPGLVSPARQELDIPDGPDLWATVLVNVYGPVGYDTVQYANLNNARKQVTESIVGLRNCTASIQFYREGAVDAAERLKTRISLSRAIEYMQQNSIGFVGFGPINDLTEVQDQNWEERAQVDMQFTTEVREEDVLDTYGTFTIELNTDTPISKRVFTIEEP